MNRLFLNFGRVKISKEPGRMAMGCKIKCIQTLRILSKLRHMDMSNFESRNTFGGVDTQAAVEGLMLGVVCVCDCPPKQPSGLLYDNEIF